jgi:hypothetical protein
MIEASTVGPFEPIYTFVDRVTGENVVIAARRLEQWCVARRAEGALEIVRVPVTRAQATKIIAAGSVSRAWCEEMIVQPLYALLALPPIIFALAEDGSDDVMLVDGHHRYVVFAALGIAEIKAHILSPAQWSAFRIIGLDTITAEELREMPIVKLDCDRPRAQRGEEEKECP